jgi:hypothetical protein
MMMVMVVVMTTTACVEQNAACVAGATGVPRAGVRQVGGAPFAQVTTTPPSLAFAVRETDIVCVWVGGATSSDHRQVPQVLQRERIEGGQCGQHQLRPPSRHSRETRRLHGLYVLPGSACMCFPFPMLRHESALLTTWLVLA